MASAQFQEFKKVMNVSDALVSITEFMYNQQQQNIPVCDWPDIDIDATVKRQVKICLRLNN